MKYIHCSEYFEHIRTLISQEIIRFGLAQEKPSKGNSLKVKKSKSKEDSLNVACNAVFGNSLCSVPKVMVEDYGFIPRFLVDSVNVLENHLHVEGLFRKTGSLARQREIKGRIDKGESVDGSCAPLDICCLIKQFFRELPDPLLTFELHDTFMSSFIQFKEDKEKCIVVVLSLCLLLPPINLSTLMFLMSFLSKLISQSHENKMDASNVAICMAPNLLYTLDSFKSKKTNLNSFLATPSRQRSSDSAIGSLCLGAEATIQVETDIIRLLIENAGRIGEVSESMCSKAASFALSLSSLNSDIECHDIRCSEEKTSKMKKRGGSLQGLVSNLGSSFSRWISNRSSIQDQSLTNAERSSIISVDDSACQDLPDSFDVKLTSCDGHEEINVEEMMAKISKMPHTPKIMGGKNLGKRKATEDSFTPSLGFSARKRKAVLDSLPRHNLLPSTPFSKMFNQEKGLFTPKAANADIGYPASSANRSFNVKVPSDIKMNRAVSMRKAGGMSPKPAKQNARMKFRGLLRRLSGNKEKTLEKKQQDKDRTNESSSSKGVLMLLRTKKMPSPSPVPRNPLLGNLDLPDDESDSFLFCDLGSHLDFSKGCNPFNDQRTAQKSTIEEECRDLKRIREQRDMQLMLKRGSDEAPSVQATSNPLPNEAFEQNTSMLPDGEGFGANDVLHDISSILRRGRPNTVRNGLKCHTVQEKRCFEYQTQNEPSSPKMSILDASPVHSPHLKFMNVRDDRDGSLNFEYERDVDETVIKVLDVAFTEDDLQSIICGSMIEESSSLKIIDALPFGDHLAETNDLHNANLCANQDVYLGPEVPDHLNTLCGGQNNSPGHVEHPEGKDAKLFSPGPVMTELKLNPGGAKHVERKSSSLPEIYTLNGDDDEGGGCSTSQSSMPWAEKAQGNFGAGKGLSDPHINLMMRCSLTKVNTQIRKPSFKVTSDVQSIITKSGMLSDRYEVQLEEDCTVGEPEDILKHDIETSQEIQLDKATNPTLSNAPSKTTDQIASSRKVAKLPISTTLNRMAFSERHHTLAHSNTDAVLKTPCSGDLKENTISHLPPPSPFKPRRMQDQLAALQQVREDSRVLRRIHFPDETLEQSKCLSPVRHQPKIKAPLIATAVAKYLAAAQASSSMTGVQLQRALRSPVKSLKRLQGATSPKGVKAVGTVQPRRSPVKAVTEQGQPAKSCTIKFDLDV